MKKLLVILASLNITTMGCLTSIACDSNNYEGIEKIIHFSRFSLTFKNNQVDNIKKALILKILIQKIG